MPRESTESSSYNKPTRHLEVVCNRTLDAWFPVDGELLRKVHDNIKAGLYNEKRELLIEDLKKDFSLFTYCLRELVGLAEQKDHSPIDPSTLFREASLDDLELILSISEESISVHTFAGLNEVQATRLQQSMISASVAEALSESCNIDPDTAYSCALLRQLGLTLVAWNYPHVYNAVLSTVGSEESLDKVLSGTLGFSPTLLGISIARRWNLTPKILVAIGDGAPQHRVLEERDLLVAETLERICEIGEVFAQIQALPETPTRQGKWHDAITEIHERLGPEALLILDDKIQRTCDHYARIAPELCNWSIDVEGIRKKVPVTHDECVHHNAYIKHCSLEVREKLIELYRCRQPSVISRELVERLVKELMPLAGFSRGCVYLLEPDSLRLIPRLAIGSGDKKDFKPYEYSSPANAQQPIVAAFRSNIPVQDSVTRTEDDVVHFIAGVLGEQQRAGVLYLELSSALVGNRHSNPLVYFKALRLALCDCLMIR